LEIQKNLDNKKRGAAMKKDILFLFFLFLIAGSLSVCTENAADRSTDEVSEAPQYVIAYCYQPQKNDVHQIFTIHDDGSNDRKVIDAPIGLNHHDCSANGKKYVAVGYVGADFSTWSIHTFDADGENLVRLTTEEGVWDTEPAWSPDGDRIAITRIHPKENRREELWVMNADGSDQHNIGVEGFAAKWSPDGMRLIYASKRPDKYDIYTCAVDGTDERQLTDTEADESFPVYSPDGSRIAFCASTGEYNTPENIKTLEIYTMNPDGTGLLQLTDNECFDGYPRWSPDGSRFAFSSDRHEAFRWEVYVMNTDGTDVRRVTHSPPDVTSINPVWKIN
jgi:WD40 repeat protein